MPRRRQDRRVKRDRAGLPPRVVQLADGRYRAYTGSGSARRWSGRLSTVAEALQWLHDNRLPTPKASPELTVGEYIEDTYLPALRRELEASARLTTYDQTTSRVRHLRDLYPVKLAALTSTQIRLAEERLRLTSGLAPRTLLFIHIAFKAALKRAVRDKLLTSNPADGVDAPKVEEPVRRRPLTREQFNALWDAAIADPAGEGALVCLILAIGLRRNEATALHWEDIRWEGDQAWCDVLYSAKSPIGEGTVIGRPKTHRSLRHNILIGPEATRELRKLHERQGRPSRGLLFPSPTNPERPISTSTFAKRWDRIASAAGLKNGPFQFTSHIARHTLASQDKLLRNPERSAKFLGHTVAVYFKDYVDVDNRDNLAPAAVVAEFRAGAAATGDT